MAKITLLSSARDFMSKSQQPRKFCYNRINKSTEDRTNEMAKASDSPQGLQNYEEFDTHNRAIEKILDCVKKDGCRYYKIRWGDTWEREESLRPFKRNINDFWEQIEQQRKREQIREIHMSAINQQEHIPRYTQAPQDIRESPIHDQPPSPVYRNCTEYSPPPSELEEERSPDTSTAQLPEDFSPSPPPVLECNDYYAEEQSPGNENLPVFTSGRRKGKPKKLIPKKLIRDDEDEEIDKISPSKASNLPQNQVSSAIQPVSTKELLTVEIPGANKSPKSSDSANNGRVEEYPVMIIKETGEEPNRLQKTQIHKPDAIRFIDEPPLKRQRIPTPEYERKAPVFVPSTVASFIPKGDRYTSPVPSPEENVLHRSAPLSPMFYHHRTHPHSFGLPPSFHFSSRQSVFKSIQNYQPNSDGIPAAYHTARDVNERRVSPDLSLMYAEARKPHSKRDQISGLPLDSNKFKPSQLLLKVSRSTENPHNQILTSSQKQQFPVYQNTPNPIPTSVKSRATKETVITKAKTPTKYLVTADGEQRPQCPECFQTFKKRAALERHMMIHRGIKPFQCHFCNQRFRQKHHLQGHIMLHTGERPHSCTLCNKRFRMRHHLLEHERISHKVFR